MQIPGWLRREARDLFNFLLPPACALCLKPLDPPDPDALCQNCLDRIILRQHPSCPRCALPYPLDSGPDHLCQTCLLEKRVSFSSVTTIGHYDGLLRDAIHRFKYRDNIHLDRPLAALLAGLLRRDNPVFDLIIPIPLHRSKLRQRTYNQSALLARQLAKQLKLPLELDLLERSKTAPPQQGLSARDRHINIRDSFKLDHKLSGESILLIDDVMTTGATAREASKVLIKGGASDVHLAVLARASLR